jgi:hypothetical protein
LASGFIVFRAGFNGNLQTSFGEKKIISIHVEVLIPEAMSSTADSHVSLGGSSEASKLPFTPSQNWRALQKSLPQEHSKKRKRSGPPTTKPDPKLKKDRTTSTTYNPWRPNDSQFQNKGNPALIIQLSTEGDKVVKFVLLKLVRSLKTWALRSYGL